MISGSGLIRKAFSQKINGLIWRLQINEENGFMAIESREQESQKVYFSVLNIKNGSFLFKEKSFAEPLNANLVFLAKDSLILKLNQNSSSPECVGIIAVDVNSGNILWEKYNLSLEEITSYGIRVYDFKIYPRSFFWINHKNAAKLPNPEYPHNITSLLQFPELIYDFEIPNSINHYPIIGGVFSLNTGDIQIICFHEKFEENLQQKIVIYQDNNILFQDILIKNIQKLQPESFFMFNKQVFYIRNKDEIVSYFV
jgi:hypothetical protein